MLVRVGEHAPDLGKWAIQGAVGGLTVVWGQPGSLKSFFAMSAAVCVAAGKPWFGRLVHQGPVIYVVGEGGFGNVEMRLQMAARELGIKAGTTFDLYLSPRIDFDGKGCLEELWPEWDLIQPSLVVIDTLSRCMTGDENKQEMMQKFVERVDAIRERYDAAAIVVHHGTKDYKDSHGKVIKGTLRGSTVLPGAADVILGLDKVGSPKVLKIAAEKLKDLDTDGFLPATLFPHVVPATDQHGKYLLDEFGDRVTTLVLRESPEVESLQMDVYVTFCGLVSGRSKDKLVGYKEWEEASGKTKAQFKRAVTGLTAKGDVVEHCVGHYKDASNLLEFFDPGENYDTEFDQQVITQARIHQEDMKRLQIPSDEDLEETVDERIQRELEEIEREREACAEEEV